MRHVYGVVAKVRQAEVLQQQAAVRVRVGAHASVAAGRQGCQVRHQPSAGIEQLFGAIAVEPALQLGEMSRIGGKLGERHLVRSPRALRRQSIDFFGSRPAFGRAQHDHRPARPRRGLAVPRGLLDRGDLVKHAIEGGGHQLVHLGGLVAFDKVGLVPVALEQLLELVVRNAREHGWIGDLVAVQVQDRQDRAVGGRVQELVRMPRCRKRTGFRFPVADHTRDQQVGVVERGAKRV